MAIYHTAGKGTRLAPLPGAENNNKPGVKLPSLLTVGGEDVPITVLECVMRQTSSYAAVRKGRCSVFWGDQIFVPSVGIQPSEHPADILAALRPMPTKAEWEAEELHQCVLGPCPRHARTHSSILSSIPVPTPTPTPTPSCTATDCPAHTHTLWLAGTG